MKKIILLTLTVAGSLAFVQTSDQVIYKEAEWKNGVQSGDIANLAKVSHVNISYDFKDMAIAGKAVGESGHITEESFVNKKAALIEAKEPGKGAEFKKNWEEAKTSDYPNAFEALFNQYAINDIKMTGKNTTDIGEYNLLVRTTKIEPGYKMGVLTMLPYLDIEYIFTDKSGKELVTIFLKSVQPSAAGAPVWALHKQLAPSYEKAAKKLVELIQDTRAGKR